MIYAWETRAKTICVPVMSNYSKRYVGVPFPYSDVKERLLVGVLCEVRTERH